MYPSTASNNNLADESLERNGIPYRPYILSGAHILLENEHTETISTSEFCTLWKEQLPEILLQISDFDFSPFMNTGNMIFGKHIRAESYCEVAISMYLDIPPSSNLILEIQFLRGDYDQFRPFYKQLVSCLHPNDLSFIIDTPEELYIMPTSVEAFLGPVEIVESHLGARMLDSLHILRSAKAESVQIQELRKIALWKRFDDSLLVNDAWIGRQLVDALLAVMTTSVKDNNMMVMEFAIMTIQALCSEPQLQALFVQEAYVNILVQYLQSCPDASSPQYYRVAQVFLGSHGKQTAVRSSKCGRIVKNVVSLSRNNSPYELLELAPDVSNTLYLRY